MENNKKQFFIVLDSGLHAADSGFLVLDSVCQWNLDSRFQSLVGSEILELYSRIPEVSKAKISLIPESGFPYTGRIVSRPLPPGLRWGVGGGGRGVALSKLATRQFFNLPDNNLFSSSSISGTLEQGTIL